MRRWVNAVGFFYVKPWIIYMFHGETNTEYIVIYVFLTKKYLEAIFWSVSYNLFRGSCWVV